MMQLLRLLGGVAVLAIASVLPACAENDTPDIGLPSLAYAKIACAAYASRSDYERHKERAEGLYFSGIENLRTFTDAFERGVYSVAELRSNVPMDFGFNLNALVVSRDYFIGYTVRGIMDDATEDYTKESDFMSDDYGEWLPNEVWGIEAARLYDEKNCDVLDIKHSIVSRKIKTPPQE